MNEPCIFLLEGKRLTLNELVTELACRAAGRKAILRQGVAHAR